MQRPIFLRAFSKLVQWEAAEPAARCLDGRHLKHVMLSSENFASRESIKVPRLAVVDEHLLALTTSLPDATIRSSVAHGKTARTSWKLYVENDCNYVHRHTIKITYVRLDASTQGTPQYASVSFFEKNEDGKIIVFTGFKTLSFGNDVLRWRPSGDFNKERTVGVRIRPMEYIPIPTLDADLVPTDVKFLVDGECVPPHRSFLSIASPTFNRMLNGDFREARSDTVPIADVSASDFRDFLAWLYGNPSIVNDDNVMGLLRLSDQYLVEPLKQRCLSYVRYCEKVPLIEKFVAAERYNADSLQRYLVDCLTRADAQKLVKDTSINALNSFILKFLELLAT
ncbi:Kelch-like protein 35 [Aphelenchoides avenae]|nr:Kelch-like protein 35 [Aphelenchus avenae]